MKVRPGQIYKGGCLTSYEPNLNYCYVVLSSMNGTTWQVAEFPEELFTDGEWVECFMGGRQIEITDVEFGSLTYICHLKDIVRVGENVEIRME